MRKTAKEVLAATTPNEIHDWLWTAKIDELRAFLPFVKRGEHWGVHARDALDICIAEDNRRIANRVLILTWVAVGCGLIQAFGVVWAICTFIDGGAPFTKSDPEKIIAASIHSPMRCHSVGCGTANRTRS
jgi:hypothetical protein